MRKRAGVLATLLLGALALPTAATARLGEKATDVIVEFASAPTVADMRALQRAGFVGPFEKFDLVPVIAASASPSAIARVRSVTNRVRGVSADEVFQYNLDRAVEVGRVTPLRNATYQLNGVTQTGGFRGRGVTVATLDSGIDATHPDLKHVQLAKLAGEAGVTKANFIMLGRTSVNEALRVVDESLNHALPLGEDSALDNLLEAHSLAVPALTTDNGGHGTHVAGIIAGRGVNSDGRYVGVAPGAQLVGLSAGEVVPVSRALAAMDWLHAHHAEYGIKVFNNSWGGGGSVDMPTSLVRNAAEKLVTQDGITVVFAAGNDGGDGSAVATSYNANSPSVISVANYDFRTGWVHDTSSRGAKADPATWPDVAAPGTGVISTAMTGGAVTYSGSLEDGLVAALSSSGDPVVLPLPLPHVRDYPVGPVTVETGDYASLTGTSMAAPFVSGVTALLLEANPSLTPFQIRDILTSTANMPPGHTYAEDGYAIGHGVVDAAEAVAVALRMREGDSLAAALGHASLDLASNPAKINFATGGVTDNTIPLFPAPPAAFTAEPNIYHAGAINPLGATGTQVVVSGESVDLSARNITSTNAANPLTLNNFVVRFSVLSGATVVAGPFAGTNAAEQDAGLYESDHEWTVNPALPAGPYRLVGTLTYGANTYPLFDTTFRVVKAPKTLPLP